MDARPIAAAVVLIVVTGLAFSIGLALWLTPIRDDYPTECHALGGRVLRRAAHVDASGQFVSTRMCLGPVGLIPLVDVYEWR